MPRMQESANEKILRKEEGGLMAQVSFKGNIGKVRDIAFNNSDGKARLSFSVAEGHSRPDGNGGFTDLGVTWWNVTAFGNLAEALAPALQEGAKQRVVVAGKSSTREYEHNGQTRESLDVVADSVGLIPKRPSDQGRQQGGPQGQQPQNDPWGQQGQIDSSGWDNGNPPY